MHRVAASMLCLLLAGGAVAQDLPDGVGVAAPSGWVFATELSAGDQDDYVFQGYPGTTLTASLRVGRGSAPFVALRLLRPNGSIVPFADRLSTSSRGDSILVRFAIDATGPWKVRMSSAPDRTVLYSLRLKAGKPRLDPVALDAPDSNRQFRFTIPAQGGARIGYSLTRAGPLPEFHSLLDPRGRPVEGFPGGTSVRSFVLPAGLPLGDYALTFDAPAATGSARLVRTVRLPKSPKRRVARLSPTEPVVLAGGVDPSSGGPGAVITVHAANLADPFSPRGAVGLSLGTTPLTGVALVGDGFVRGKLPDGLAIGRYDVVVTSTSGQPAVLAGAFERVPAPVIESIDPLVGSALGGFEVLVTGRNFRVDRMAILIDGIFQPVTPTFVDDATVRFTAPPHGAGAVSIGVADVGSNLRAEQTNPAFEYVSTPAIGRVTPPLVPVLGSDTITLDGVFFSPTDKVFLETATRGVYEELAASQTTYVDPAHHRFVAPPRPSGEYHVYVEDELGRPNPRKPKTLAFFSFADATAASGLGALAGDTADATASTLADLDGDGDLDLVLSRRAGQSAETASQTRLLLNDGHASFTDATAAMMPAAGTDDWRAERVAAADIDGDGFVDLVLTTNSLTVPPAGRSHTRILLNEVRGGTGPTANGRLFRDRTADVMPPARTMTHYGAFGGSSASYVSDDWRGLDLWVGDLDKSGGGRPEILVTHDETKSDNGTVVNGVMSGVYCGNYCFTPYASAYPYFFYWGGTRTFSWDKNARGGQGRYRFEASNLPRSVGVYPFTTGWGAGTFTPFTGKRVAVGDIDHDLKPDVAVISDKPVLVSGQWASSLQVALQGFDPSTGAKFTDATPKLTALGYDLSGDCLAIGVTGFLAGSPYASIAVAWSQRQPGRSLSLYQFVSQGGLTQFQDVTYSVLPLPTPEDGLQASQMRFADVDQDGDQDLVLSAPAAPGGTQSAFRVLRNEEVAGLKGVFRRSFDKLTSSSASDTEHLEGDALAIGDLTGDGFLEYVVSRRTPGVVPDTRILSTVK